MPKLGNKLKQEILPLQYTPRKFVSHPQNSFFYLIEADHRVMSEAATEERIKVMVSIPSLIHDIISFHIEQEMSNEKVDREMLELDPQTFGYSKAPAGTWASCIRIVDPVNVSRSTSLS